MIRIPTGKVPANTARNLSLFLGVVFAGVSFALPQYAPLLREIATALGALGITLGDARKP
ncbi:MAG TPA: hypothetical protein VJN18_35890 [Polyangiaceae bacterium]|nr:hypothetical protein [Polyangiaceae bacterium]